MVQYSRYCTKVEIFTNYDEYANLKKWVFIKYLKQLMFFALLTSNGKTFHKVGPAYLNDRAASVLYVQRPTSSRNALPDLTTLLGICHLIICCK